MNYFKRKPWIITIIGELIALTSIFTPATTWNPAGSFAIQWMFQLGLRTEPFIEFGLWRTDPGLLSLSIILSVIIFASALSIITLTIIYKRSSRDYPKLRWMWLLSAVLIAISTLVWIIMMELFYNAAGSSHWESYHPNFGVIGPFIAAGLIIAAFFLAKNVERNE
ncbi:MAG: hypothetical protein ACFFB0_10690 [Promethearchaeota archaeon]